MNKLKYAVILASALTLTGCHDKCQLNTHIAEHETNKRWINFIDHNDPAMNQNTNYLKLKILVQSVDNQLYGSK